MIRVAVIIAWLLPVLCAVLPPYGRLYAADDSGSFSFNDAPLKEEVVLPDWFKLSFLNLRDDLHDAVADHKTGLIVYFGQKFCPYCKKLMVVDFGKSDIAKYTQVHFDVTAIDIWGDRQVTDMHGVHSTEKVLAEREKTDFTPSLIFYDRSGRVALRLRGYYPPYQFRAALEYVVDGNYKTESFRSYLERANPPPRFNLHGLNEDPFFAAPPYALDRSSIPASRPLAVFFEQGDCYACDVLHGGPLQERAIRERLRRMDVVQLDIWADTPVITPLGRHITARQWAAALGLFYTPTLIFYDDHGREIIRVDSVVNFYRLRGVLDYVLSGGYRKGVSYQQWRRKTEQQQRPAQ